MVKLKQQERWAKWQNVLQRKTFGGLNSTALNFRFWFFLSQTTFWAWLTLMLNPFRVRLWTRFILSSLLLFSQWDIFNIYSKLNFFLWCWKFHFHLYILVLFVFFYMAHQTKWIMNCPSNPWWLTLVLFNPQLVGIRTLMPFPMVFVQK